MTTKEQLLEAVARGWCHPENGNKVMDEALAVAIAEEVGALGAIEDGMWRIRVEQVAAERDDALTALRRLADMADRMRHNDGGHDPKCLLCKETIAARKLLAQYEPVESGG